MQELEIRPERAMLVSLDTGEYDTEASLIELEGLVESAGAEVVLTCTQKRSAPKAATCVGTGMADQIAESCEQEEIELLVFDRELSPTQIRNLEKICDVRVIDRTMLILDIFAIRAQSSEGKVQVELAQLKYMLPRLSGKGIEMSRLGAGIGTRGPGETKLETDRRHIRRKIDHLKEQLLKIEQTRELGKKRRKKESIPIIALVGYTNAGKSTIMNRLTEAGVLAKDQLFATLDPTARAWTLPSGRTAILVDTVGFIQRFPHHLAEAFHSTLEQAVDADVIINVCDASSTEVKNHIEVTEEILRDLGSAGKPILTVMNKWDLVTVPDWIFSRKQTFQISALNGDGIEKLLLAVEDSLPDKTLRLQLLLPFSKGDLAAYLWKEGMVEDENYVEDGIEMVALISEKHFSKVEPYVKKKL